MREILFRGKRLDNREWVYGHLVQLVDATSICALGCGDSYTFIEVAPATVGQYTGLTDKRGNKIFEGDLLESHNYGKSIVHQIIYNPREASFMAMLTVAPLDGYYNSISQEWVSVHRKTIIGNIHDNPELTKGGDR